MLNVKYKHSKPIIMNQSQQTQQPTLLNTLKIINSHERDANLLFDEPTHKYTIINDPESKYTSVTTWNHSHFAKFDADEIIKKMMTNKKTWNNKNKYWNLTPEQIKEQWAQNAAAVSGAGTDMHFHIECFMNQLQEQEQAQITHESLLQTYTDGLLNGILPYNVSEEWDFFLQYIRASPQFKPYRTEWTIYHEELKIAGSIDMVYENPDGSLSIYDWKRAKEITKTNMFKKYAITEEIAYLPDTNFWHYSLQLNTYKAIIEQKYGKNVKDLYLVRLHPSNPKKTFELIKCADLSKEINILFELRRKEIQ